MLKHQEQHGAAALFTPLGLEDNSPKLATSTIRTKNLRISLLISDSSLPFLYSIFRQPGNIEDTPCPNNVFSRMVC